MADPSTSAAPLAAAAAKSALSGSVAVVTLPFDPLTMGIGLVAALVALLNIAPPPGQERTHWRVFALVGASGFLSGVFVPIVVAGGVNYLPWIAASGNDGMSYAAAALIGAAPHVAPTFWRLWRGTKGGRSDA